MSYARAYEESLLPALRRLGVELWLNWTAVVAAFDNLVGQLAREHRLACGGFGVTAVEVSDNFDARPRLGLA